MILLNDRINDAFETEKWYRFNDIDYSSLLLFVRETNYPNVRQKLKILACNQFLSIIGQNCTKIANTLDVIESSRQRKRYFVSL